MIRRVSSSGRTCGRPRQRRSWLVSISAMLLHDACHSIDSPKIGSILENIKFPNFLSSGATVMTQHSTAFEAERPVPIGDPVRDLLPGGSAEGGTGKPSPVPTKFKFRKLLMAGAAGAGLSRPGWGCAGPRAGRPVLGVTHGPRSRNV